jgi:hypothetical protein
MPIKLVCLDLDCTILNGRLNWSLEQGGVAPGKADAATLDFHLKNVGGIKNRLALQRTIKDLLKKNVKVVITSFCSHPETLPFVLEKIGLTPDEISRIKNVSTRPDEDTRKAQGKNDMIAQAMSLCGCGIKPNEVVLVDDNLNNYELARQKGYNVIWVQGSENDVGYLNELRELTGLSRSESMPLATATPAAQPQKSWVDKVLGWFGVQRIPSIVR